MDETTPIGVLVSWFPMLLLIGVWIYFMRSVKSGPLSAQQKIVEEYRQHNALLRDIIDRMDKRIARLEDRDKTDGAA